MSARVEKCRRCRGTGDADDEQAEQGLYACPVCFGSGEIEVIEAPTVTVTEELCLVLGGDVPSVSLADARERSTP